MADFSRILTALFEARFGSAPSEAVPLAVAGSGRQYYRLAGPSGDGVDGFADVGGADGVSCIGVVSENHIENESFLYLSEHFRSRGIYVPEIYAVSADRTAYLQQDLGGVSLFSAVASGRARAQAAFKERGGSLSDCADGEEIYSPEEEALLCAAVAKLPEIQIRGAEGLDFSRCFPVPEMDARSIMFDLNYFKYCYLLPACVEFDELRLQDEFEKLTSVLLGERYDSFMYRDFQARNVMLVDGEPYFIDYQGGRRGPIYYDVASFMWQASSCFPSALRRKMLDTYMAALGKYQPVSRDEFMSRLRIFLLFRFLQVLGAYGFRGCFQRKSHFIESIPFALENVRELLAEPFDFCPYLSQLLLTLADKGSFVGNSQSLTGDGDHLVVKITSFSYKEGIPEDSSGNGGGYVFDCRGLNNPGRHERFRNSTGRDADVIEFLEEDGGVFPFLDGVYAMVDPHVDNFITRGFTSLCVNFGCTGGRHRSVYCAEALAKHLSAKFPVAEIVLTHSRLGTVRRFGADGK
ncbi:MAG: phosphotransferase [Bacteroidales bacterium]|nr:phosphotransferase [Bacteroidales bacterium]